MSSNKFTLGGDEPVGKIDSEDDFPSVDIASDGDDEDDQDDSGDEFEIQQDSDNEFRLDGYDDLGIDDDDDDDYAEDILDCDAKYDTTITGQKRKRVKSPATTPKVRTSRFAPRSSPGNEETFILQEGDGFVSKPSSRVPGTFGRATHKKGDTMPAYHKKVTHVLDSDDELMMAMREKGFSDRQIAEKLVQDGRMRYDQKSISTRISRIRLAQADNVDFLLQEGYKEWEFEDDLLLMKAIGMADIEVNYELERIRAWRFRKVSDYMRRLNKDAVFSATACRERYNTLVEGTGRIPIEVDDNPDARRMELELYREEREQTRSQEQAAKEARELKERKTKNASRVKNAQKAEEVAHKRQNFEEAKAARAMARAAAAQLRSQRAAENAISKAERNNQLKKQQAIAWKEKMAKRAEKEKIDASDKMDITPTIHSSKITEHTRDPRRNLAMPDIIKMCADRGLQVKDKDKNMLIKDLKEADEEWTFLELQKMCRSKGIKTNGNKYELRYQLALAAARRFQSFDLDQDLVLKVDDEMDVGKE